jgi:hypothetical protein
MFLTLILYVLALAGEAVDENGQLKDAADMDWFNDPGDTVPIASGSRMFSQFIF